MGIESILGGASPVGLGLSVASQIFGAIKGGQANKANERMINEQIDKNQARYGLESSRDYMDTNYAQNVIKQYRESLQRSQKDTAGRAAVTGGSDEAQLAANSNAQQNFNQGMGNLAAQGEGVQMQKEQQFLQQQAALNSQMQAINQGKAANAANLVANGADLMNTMAFNSMFGKQPLNPGAGESATSTPNPYTDTTTNNGQTVINNN